MSEPPGLRDLDRLVFNGVETFDEEEIRRALIGDFELIVAAHPDANLFDFLKVLETTIFSGYEYAGFPEAGVEVLYNSTFERVEVNV